MNILFFSSYYHPYLSGVTTYPRKVLTHLSQNNNSITILTFAHKPNLEKFDKDSNTSIIRMPYNFKISKGFISLSSIRYFFDYQKKADLVLLNIPNFEGLLLAILAKLSGKKIISIFHCHVTVSNHPLKGIIEFFLNFSIYIQLALSSTIIIYTHDYFDQLRMEKKFKNKTVQIFPPVTKLKVDKNFAEKLKTQKGKKTWVGFAGRISYEKGIHVLIDAVSKMNTSQVIEIVFAGPFGSQVVGEAEYYHKIKSQLTKNKIPHTFFGPLHSDKLGAFYQAIDLLVLPSINQTEAFGMVQVEAMQLGIPVVASDLPGVRVPIQQTRMGLVSKPSDSSSLSLAIDQVLSNKSKYSNNKLAQRANQIFSINSTYTKLEKVIN